MQQPKFAGIASRLTFSGDYSRIRRREIPAGIAVGLRNITLCALRFVRFSISILFRIVLRHRANTIPAPFSPVLRGEGWG